MKKFIIILLLIFIWSISFGANESLVFENVDTINKVDKKNVGGKSKDVLRTVGHDLYEFVKNFSRVDTNYIEPQHYNFQLMLQNTNSYEMYTLKGDNDQKLVFTPEPTYRIGPYFGWRWIFLGYTIDLKHISSGGNKKEFGLSLYSSQLGIDIFYRNVSNGFKVNSCNLGEGIDNSILRGAEFDGLKSSIKGFNLYYIFNHKKFSYPAAFSQSTVQRRSCGSLMLGLSYTKQNITLDGTKLNNLIDDYYGSDVVMVDSGLLETKVHYSDYAVSCGYGYNWVFAHNWLFAASLSGALGYKHSIGDTERKTFSFRDFSFSNFNLDGIGRFGIVWNNTKWFVGSSAIIHTYNYKKNRFSTNTTLGNINFYVGFNFDRR